MRNTVIGSFLLLSLIISSCTDDEPLTAQPEPRDKFTGMWTVNEETNGSSSGSYPSIVVKDSANASQIRINNIFNLGNDIFVKALVAGNSLDINSQLAGGLIISGSGQFNGTSFVLNYTVNDGSGNDSVKATYIK